MNITKISNKYINNVFIFLRKGVYPYEYKWLGKVEWKKITWKIIFL